MPEAPVVELWEPPVVAVPVPVPVAAPVVPDAPVVAPVAPVVAAVPVPVLVAEPELAVPFRQSEAARIISYRYWVNYTHTYDQAE